MSNVHHYAPCVHLPRIYQSGVLRPSNAGAPNEKPLLWFSANQRWEPTATKMIADASGKPVLLTFEQQLELLGCCRFSLPANDSRLLKWAEARRAAGMGYTVKRKLEEIGRKRGGNPLDWFAVAESIDVASLTFSVFENERWVPASLPEQAEKWADA